MKYNVTLNGSGGDCAAAGAARLSANSIAATTIRRVRLGKCFILHLVRENELEKPGEGNVVTHTMAHS